MCSMRLLSPHQLSKDQISQYIGMNISIQYGLFITILLFLVCQASQRDAKVYWRSKLPNTLMPKAVHDALPIQGNIIGDRLRAVADTKDHPWATADEVMLQEYEDDDDHCHEEVHRNRTDFVTSRFFLAKDLVMGAKHSVHFKTGSISTRFPPHNLAQSMPPFNSNNLNDILRFFSVKPGSTAAGVMLFNLRRCERNNPINGNWQYCATSLDQLVSYVASTLGGSDDVKAMTLPPSAFKSDALLTYKIVVINALAADKYMVACHRAGFPYAVFKCHQPEGATAYQVTLAGVHDEAIIKAYAVCHSDTSGWNPKFIGLKTLGVKPGTPICHFLQFHDVVWYRPSQAFM